MRAKDMSHIKHLLSSYVDFNECQTEQHVCNPSTSFCTNGIGNYKCHCKSGFASQVNAVNENTCEGTHSVQYRYNNTHSL